ncbi:SEN1 N terminal-domain-containing protein [Podospora conica]|nr:SEN1 N terminal-domain-containing protein [Schizothecium conicum]
MEANQQIFDALLGLWNEFKAFPPEAHLFCPKTDDDDVTNYDEPNVDEEGASRNDKAKHIEEGKARHLTAYRLSLLLALRPEEAGAWLTEWSDTVNSFLTRCDSCAIQWHKSREKFLKGLESDLEPAAIDHIQLKLNEFDKERIDRGLAKAKALLDQQGPKVPAKLAEQDLSAVLALFEALCSMAYLHHPDNRTNFDYVFRMTQQRRPLRMSKSSGLIPTMTFFLFDEDPYRVKFAQASWQRIPPHSLSVEEWDWSVGSQLTEAILRVTSNRGPVTPEKITRFWQGIQAILPALSEQRIRESLRAMEVSPSVYLLALDHLDSREVTPEALTEILKGLRTLLDGSSKAFWAAFDQVTPSVMVEQIFKSKAFIGFLDNSLIPEQPKEDGTSNGKVPLLADWLRALIHSLPLNRRSDACETILRHLFETYRVMDRKHLSEEGRITSTLAGLASLHESLEGFVRSPSSFDTGTSLMIVNQLLNRVVQYKEVIVDTAHPRSVDKINVGQSTTAVSIIHSALALDAMATRVEWNALIEGVAVQDAVKRDSGQLWESFLEMLWSGQVELAKAMLMATMPLRSIERFIPLRKAVLDQKQKQFNARYEQQTTAIGKMLGRLSDFNASDLDRFCSEPQGETIAPIVSSLIHGEEAIREAGMELIKATTGEFLPSEAINKMLEEYLCPFLNAFAGAINNLAGEKKTHSPWAHMMPLLKCSELVLDGMCDTGVGQLRLKTLTPAERTTVRVWWESQWQVVGHSFKMMRTWHSKVDKKTMENFCRDVIDLANRVLAQDGLVASALTAPDNEEGDSAAAAMKIVLTPCNAIAEWVVDMLQLQDLWLIQGIIGLIQKLVGRLKDSDIALSPKAVALVHSMTKKRLFSSGTRGYPLKTNLTDEQRIELLKALGEDAEIEIQFIGARTIDRGPNDKAALKQSRIDFTKASTASLSASIKADLDSLTPHSDKRKATLDALPRPLPKPLSKPLAKPRVETKPLISGASIKEARLKEKAEKAKRDADAIAKAKALRAPPKIVAGEGSGLLGISATRGKDHAPVAKDEIMVGSSSEDDDSDDDDDMLVRRAGAGKKSMDEAERRRRGILVDQRGPVKKQRVQRSAKDMRARLIPPMDILHQAILEWDIFHGGNDPPNGYRLAEVSDSYTDPQSYKKTFFPLLINEAWRSFVTSKDETTSKPFGVKVLSRMTVDKFMEVTATVKVTISRERGCSEGDIVILSKGGDPLNQPGEHHCLARIWKTAYKKENVEISFRLSTKGNQILSSLIPGSETTVVKITNMTTIEREYAALESLQYYDLMQEVLHAEPSPMQIFGKEAVEGVMRNYQLNTGQAKAILNAKENDGFTLVQGPPGTGKTKTIVAMVGCLLPPNSLKSTNGAVSISKPDIPGSYTPKGTSKKLLVCAPSNAAVDELVLRLKAGVKSFNGGFHKINVVRLGRPDAINAAVRDVTLEELVKTRMDAELNNNVPNNRDLMHKQAGEIKKQLDELRPQLEAARASEDRDLAMKIQREFDELKRRQAHVGARIDADKSSGNTYAREAEIKKRQIQQDILDKAHVLCATLSGSGHEMFKNLNVEFETVIIDEAAQCVELSALIPLKYGCHKCILVGDPKQLPPTVLSQSAARYGYDQSLFVRMQKNHASDVHLLDQQYRMHPEISLFPSREFYEGLLQDGADMGKMRMQPWHQSALLGPYRFFDVKGSQQRGPRNQSLVNDEELNVAMQLYQRIRADYGDVDFKGKIGIITPYKAQLFRLRDRFTQRYGESILQDIEFNTTDAFQGRECEIIIFSCVRASPTGGIGFMTDIRRMNVGLTRAKSSLWILGDSRALVQGEFWAKLIDDARQRDRYTTGNVMGLLSQPGQKLSPSAFAALQSGGYTKQEAKKEERTVIELDEDVVMTDAPSYNSRPPKAGPPGPAPDSRRSSTSQLRSSEGPPPPTIPYRGQGIGGLDGRGEAGQVVQRNAGPPMIQTTSTTKKRHLEDGQQPDAKKVCDSPRSNHSPDAPTPPQTRPQNEVLMTTPNSPDTPAPANATRPVDGAEGSQAQDTSSTGGPIGHGGAGLGAAFKALASCAWTAKWS